jgi:hypothetical protein
MANEEQLAILRQGVEVWNAWREHSDVRPDLSGADLREAVLRQVDLNKAELSRVILTKANLSRANLSHANLGDANLSGAILRETNLSGAFLRKTNLSGAFLYEANLSEAFLDESIFSEADLGGANFSTATLMKAVLTSVDLSTVIGLETVTHFAPSSIGIDTLYRSQGKIPEVFLRGCGVPDPHIEYLPALVGAMQPVQFYSCFISYSSKNEDFARRLHERMQAAHLRVWFAPEDVKGGEKLHEQIERAIQMHDRLLLVLSEQSIQSEWVQHELRRARRAEIQSQRRKLFPIRLLDFEALQEWECLDSRSGSDLAEEVRQYFIPDFSRWKQDHDAFERAFARLLRDLKATNAPPAPAPQPAQPQAPTATATMLSAEDISGQQKLLATHRRTLASYLQRLSILTTAHAPPEIDHGIDEARANIAHVKAILRASGMKVADHPDDTAD